MKETCLVDLLSYAVNALWAVYNFILTTCRGLLLR